MLDAQHANVFAYRASLKLSEAACKVHCVYANSRGHTSQTQAFGKAFVQQVGGAAEPTRNMGFYWSSDDTFVNAKHKYHNFNGNVLVSETGVSSINDPSDSRTCAHAAS